MVNLAWPRTHTGISSWLNWPLGTPVGGEAPRVGVYEWGGLKLVNAKCDGVSFQPGTELLADRARTREAVKACLTMLRSGVLPNNAERQRVDFQEEAGRRGSGGRLLPGFCRKHQGS